MTHYATLTLLYIVKILLRMLDEINALVRNFIWKLIVSTSLICTTYACSWLGSWSTDGREQNILTCFKASVIIISDFSNENIVL